MKVISKEQAWLRFKKTKAYKEATAKTIGIAFVNYLFRHYNITSPKPN